MDALHDAMFTDVIDPRSRRVSPADDLVLPRAGRFSEGVKRTTDIAFASVALAVLSPLMLLTALAVRFSSRGPIFFRQERVGRSERCFRMFKFRTMYQGNDDSSHREYVRGLLTSDEVSDGGDAGVYKLSSDPRVTRVGALLRRTSLDELPQLFNVLLGSMSLVGPRPALPWEVELFKAEHRVRFAVKPGITGLWQVGGRSKLPMLDGLALDAEYVRRRSLLLDLRVLLITIPVVLTGRGAR
jgi:lipopolysaccharide/colanic/teichoic acid biosynthesis glycosyltransferase